MSRLLRRTPAKINLGLELLGKRSDGYHEINTLFLPVTLCDTLEVVVYDELALQCTPSLDIPSADNIVVKAAEALQRAAGTKQGAFIRLEKGIPHGAGLGGGSSDAATALQLLNELWKTGLSDDELRGIAAELGSDVPFFIAKTAAVGRGRGEILAPADISLGCAVVIVRPKAVVSTAWAYRSALPAAFQTKPTDFTAIVRNLPPGEWRDYLFNDFEHGVFRYHPPVASAKRALYEAGAEFALMSGSGSCVFGLFSDHARAERVAANFAAGYFCRQFIPQDLNEPFS